MDALKRQRLWRWEAELLLVQVAAGWEVRVDCQNHTHPKPFRSRAEAEAYFAACVRSDQQLSRDWHTDNDASLKLAGYEPTHWAALAGSAP
jgi:hypothetical protein